MDVIFKYKDKPDIEPITVSIMYNQLKARKYGARAILSVVITATLLFIQFVMLKHTPQEYWRIYTCTGIVTTLAGAALFCRNFENACWAHKKVILGIKIYKDMFS